MFVNVSSQCEYSKVVQLASQIVFEVIQDSLLHSSISLSMVRQCTQSCDLNGYVLNTQSREHWQIISMDLLVS